MMFPSFKSQVMEFLSRNWMWLLGAAAGLVFLDVVWAAVTYLIYPGYLDHGEPVVAITSWRVLEGFPAYPPFDSPDRTTNIYGPVTLLIHAAVYALAGPGIASSKAAGLIAMVLTPVVVFLTQRRYGPMFALAAFILAGGFALLALPASLWNRPDPLLAVFVALSVWAAVSSVSGRPEWGKSLLIGLCGGLAAGMKIHAGLYFIPVVLFHCCGRGIKPLLFIAVVGVLTILAPFAFEPFSLSDFLSWFPPVAAKELDFMLLPKILRYSLFYLTPVIFFIAALKWAEGSINRAETVYFGSFVLCVLASFVLASKPGAGWYYFFPFLAICVDMITRYSQGIIRNKGIVLAGVGVVAAVLMMVSVPIQKRFAEALHWESARRITDELRAIIDDTMGKTVQMGTGDTLDGYRNTFYKPLLVFAGHPYTLDVGVMIETSKLGIKLPKEAVTRLENCYTDIWLVPAGERPFEMIGYYGNPVFDPSFRAAFIGHYEKRKSFNYFDAWVCRE